MTRGSRSGSEHPEACEKSESHPRQRLCENPKSQQRRECAKFEIPPTQLVDGSYSAYNGPHAEHAVSEIPPPQLVDRSYSAYNEPRLEDAGFRNPTNAVGGLFILSLQKSAAPL